MNHMDLYVDLYNVPKHEHCVPAFGCYPEDRRAERWASFSVRWHLDGAPSVPNERTWHPANQALSVTGIFGWMDGTYVQLTHAAKFSFLMPSPTTRQTFNLAMDCYNEPIGQILSQIFSQGFFASTSDDDSLHEIRSRAPGNQHSWSVTSPFPSNFFQSLVINAGHWTCIRRSEPHRAECSPFVSSKRTFIFLQAFFWSHGNFPSLVGTFSFVLDLHWNRNRWGRGLLLGLRFSVYIWDVSVLTDHEWHWLYSTDLIHNARTYTLVHYIVWHTNFFVAAGCVVKIRNRCPFSVTACSQTQQQDIVQYDLRAGASQTVDLGATCIWTAAVVYASVTGKCAVTGIPNAATDRNLANLAEFTIGSNGLDFYDLSNVVSWSNLKQISGRNRGAVL